MIVLRLLYLGRGKDKMEKRRTGEDVKKTAQTLLVDISRSFETLAQQFKELAGVLAEASTREEGKRRQSGPQGDLTPIIEKLKGVDREEAEKLLQGLSQEELGSIFATFGPSRDRKKPKQWLINQILWHFYDFEAGHRLLRGDTGQ